jgi:hypothetical protein
MNRWLPDEGAPIRTVDSGAAWHVCLLDDGRYQAQVLLAIGRCVLHCGEGEAVALRVEHDDSIPVPDALAIAAAIRDDLGVLP